MARFRGTLQGQRGDASRLGSKASGLTVEANGWDTGVRVTLWVDDDGRDRVTVQRTGGSHARTNSRTIAEWVEGDDAQPTNQPRPSNAEECHLGSPTEPACEEVR